MTTIDNVSSALPAPRLGRPFAGDSASTRSASLVAGSSLAAMAVLAPVAVFGLIPQGATAPAGLIILGVAVLDIIAAFALSRVLDPADGFFSRITAGLRAAYGAGFAVAASWLLVGSDATRFEQIWDAILLVFGAHLICAGILGWRTRVLPRWISVLVVIAGMGYLADTVSVALGGDLGASTVAFVGEVALLVWLLVWGGRPRTNTNTAETPSTGRSTTGR